MRFSRVTEEEVEAVRACRDKGLGLKATAAATGITAKRVNYICAKWSIKRNAPEPLFYVDGLQVSEHWHANCKKLFIKQPSGKWRLLKQYVYERHYGVALTHSDIVRMRDGNERNMDPSNMVLVTRAQLLKENGDTEEAKAKRSASRKKLWAKFQRFVQNGLPTKSFTNRTPLHLRPRNEKGRFVKMEPGVPLTVYKPKNNVRDARKDQRQARKAAKRAQQERYIMPPAKNVNIS